MQFIPKVYKPFVKFHEWLYSISYCCPNPNFYFFIYGGKEQTKCHFFFSIPKHLPDTFPVKEELAYISAWIRRCANITESRQAKTWSVSTTQRDAVQQSVTFGKHNCRFLVKLTVTLEVFWKTQNKVWQLWWLVLDYSYLYHSSAFERQVSVPLCFVSTTIQ